MGRVTDPAVEAEVIAAEDHRRAALVGDDMAALADILASDLVHVHTTGIVHTKAELLVHAGTFLRFLSVSRGELTVRQLAADVVVMTGSMTNVVTLRQQHQEVTVQAFVTQLWIRAPHGWKLASFHATKLQPAPP